MPVLRSASSSRFHDTGRFRARGRFRPMPAEALPPSNGPSAGVRFVSPPPEVALQVADALRWFFACAEDSNSPAYPEATDMGLHLRAPAPGSPAALLVPVPAPARNQPTADGP